MEGVSEAPDEIAMVRNSYSYSGKKSDPSHNTLKKRRIPLIPIYYV